MGIYDKKIGIKDAILDVAFGREYYVNFRSREIMKLIPRKLFGVSEEYTGCMLSEDRLTIFAENNKYKDQIIKYAKSLELCGKNTTAIINGKRVYPPKPSNLEKEVEEPEKPIETEPVEIEFVDPWKIEIPKYEIKKSKFKSPWGVKIPELKDK